MAADYHVHIENGPYTIEWLKKFIDSGLSKGLVEIGISEHGHRFKEGYNAYKSDGFRGKWIKDYMDQSISDYVELIKEAKAMGLPVKLGIEADYFPGKEKEIKEFLEPYPWDYVIGSVHWIEDWGIDLEESIEEWKTRDVDSVYLEYFNIIEKMAKTGLFDIIGHIDLVKIFGFRAKPYTFDKIRRNIKEISKAGIVIEVSTAGLRKPVGEIYPSKEIMGMIKEYNIPIVVNSDAHNPYDVARDFDKAYAYVKSYGINTLYYFEGKKRTPYNI
ncbi:histidinol phosphate phosphatase HisJ family [Thermoanaerobacter italicus Ab9]|uniref:Histidinol-phosphatase n=1 Tax=Thermoanaerobacter italicus (strain DSM 9252 / Ab9) TaxID=580331 RepID=D3T680_THEIA|nr:histidinol-phosphatase [Thermoanaerobacter italicus]ADD03474.1 histidinol phosphate phosphatase HisJ family [Thermoanaerobacter italicus Ab9]